MIERRYQGAIHMHTNLSHDGELSFEELTSFLRGKGYDFMAITEHSYDVTQASMDGLAAKARQATTGDFLVIPGIEFRCDSGVDILGLGVTKMTEAEDISIVIDHIHAHRGVAIFAHPGQNRRYRIAEEWVTKLDGAEIYNLKEGKLMPNFRTMKICETMKKWHPELKIYFGLDLHATDGFLYLSSVVRSDRLSQESILASLREGCFSNTSLLFKLGSGGRLSIFNKTWVYCIRTLLNFVRWSRDKLKI